MDELNRNLMQDALERHDACLRSMSDVHDRSGIIARLVEIEGEAWSESPLEVENRPMLYRHLLSVLDDLSLVEERYAACENDYLKQLSGERYAELLEAITDVDRLMELSVRAHPGLRPFVILRLQHVLPDALKAVSAQSVPKWFTRLLRQPHEVSNFLSQATCNAVIEKVRKLLAN